MGYSLFHVHSPLNFTTRSWQTFVLSCFYLCRREINLTDLKKADLLLINFCKRAQNLYGKSSITPNMHLHGHLTECAQDYGSIYNFWLFSYERYNGILGDYPTNKRNTAAQLMRRFIYEAETFQIPLPNMFQENFGSLLPLHKHVSEIHQHEVCPNVQKLPDVVELSMGQPVHTPSCLHSTLYTYSHSIHHPLTACSYSTLCSHPTL